MLKLSYMVYRITYVHVTMKSDETDALHNLLSRSHSADDAESKLDGPRMHNLSFLLSSRSTAMTRTFTTNRREADARESSGTISRVRASLGSRIRAQQPIHQRLREKVCRVTIVVGTTLSPRPSRSVCHEATNIYIYIYML